MDASDIEALRSSVEMLRQGTDHLEKIASNGHGALSAKTRAEMRAAARHIDELLGRGETVSGDGFEIVAQS